MPARRAGVVLTDVGTAQMTKYNQIVRFQGEMLLTKVLHMCSRLDADAILL